MKECRGVSTRFLPAAAFGLVLVQVRAVVAVLLVDEVDLVASSIETPLIFLQLAIHLDLFLMVCEFG